MAKFVQCADTEGVEHWINLDLATRRVRAYWVLKGDKYEKLPPTGAKIALEQLSGVLREFAEEMEAFE